VQLSKLSSPRFYQLSTMSSYDPRSSHSKILRLKSHQLLSYSYECKYVKAWHLLEKKIAQKETAKTQLTEENHHDLEHLEEGRA
jgi:hypothetical protein